MTQSHTQNTQDSFEKFGLHEKILKGVQAAGFSQPSQIQQQAIPLVLKGGDVIAQAQTGTGKTAAFGLPSMSRIIDTKANGVQILVITPTRELAAQVSDEMYRLGKFAELRTTAVYGGQSIQRQVDLINRGSQIVVATPGRLLDHLTSGRLNHFKPSIVILDEADEMLDMGFLDDIKEIFTHLPKERQTLLFSATLAPEIKRLAESILKSPTTINVAPNQLTNTDIEQLYYVIEEQERNAAIIRLIDSEDLEKAIIFCRTIKETDELSMTLSSRGYNARPLHGDMEQNRRQEAIKFMQQGRLDILVATDVAARGLDIQGISHVFNYHMPFNSESYVHRIGRTGRAGKKGKAITLVTPAEYRKLKHIQKNVKLPLIHCAIPSIKEVIKSYYPKLVDTVMSQTDRDESVEILSMLEQNLSSTEIATKLISLLLDKKAITGPEEIGVRGDRLGDLLNGNSERRDSRSPHGRKGRTGGFGGGYNNRGGQRSGGGDRRFGGSDGDRRSGGGERRSGDGERRFGGGDRDGYRSSRSNSGQHFQFPKKSQINRKPKAS